MILASVKIIWKIFVLCFYMQSAEFQSANSVSFSAMMVCFNVNSVFSAFVWLFWLYLANRGLAHKGYSKYFFHSFPVFSTACLKLNHMEIISFDSLLIVTKIYLISPITGRFLQGMKHNMYFAKWYILKSSPVDFVKCLKIVKILTCYQFHFWHLFLTLISHMIANYSNICGIYWLDFFTCL